MDNFPNRYYISVRLSALAEDIKAHTALTEDDEKIVLCCLNEIKCLIELNRKCYEYNMKGVRNDATI